MLLSSLFGIQRDAGAEGPTGRATPMPCGRDKRSHRGRRPEARRLHFEPLELRVLLDGMSLVGQWDHDHPGSLFGDVWGQVIPRGRSAGTYAYLGHFGDPGGGGVDIVDISDPANPVLASHFHGAGGANDLVDVKVDGDIGYFASDDPDNGGVFVVDVSNPLAPQQLARIDASNGGFGDVHNVFVEDGYLYEVDNGTSEVRVFDVSDPANPLFVRTIPGAFPGESQGIHDVTVKDGRLYTAAPFTGRIGIFDIRNVGDLSSPVRLIGSFKDPAGATHSLWPTEDGQFLVVAHEFVGLDVEIYDISDLTSPVLASSIEGPAAEYTAHNPIVIGDLLYASWFEEGVRVYNIADPYNPILVASFDTYTGPYDEPGECAGFETGRTHPRFTDFAPYPVACGAWGVYPFLGIDRILVSDFDGGLFIVSLDDPPVAPAGSSSVVGAAALGAQEPSLSGTAGAGLDDPVPARGQLPPPAPQGAVPQAWRVLAQTPITSEGGGDLPTDPFDPETNSYDVVPLEESLLTDLAVAITG